MNDQRTEKLARRILDPGSTHYQVLDVSPLVVENNAKAVLGACRAAVAKVFHPDRWANDPAGARRAHDVMSRANVAYETLLDAKKRKPYRLILPKTHRPCPRCAGDGAIRKSQGFSAVTYVACRECDGAGYLLKKETK